MPLTEAEIIRATQTFLSQRRLTGTQLPVYVEGRETDTGWRDILLVFLAYEEYMRELQETL